MPSRQFGLDLIRSVAIFCVLACHWGDDGGLLPTTARPALWASGFAGVEIFFVLSGFLIGRILVRTLAEDAQFGGASLAVFWLRRWFRTLPSYFLFLALFLHFNWFGWSAAWPFVWFGQNLRHPNLYPFGISWSLAVEEWFYLALPLLVFTLARFRLPALKSLGLACLMILAGSMAWRCWQGVGLEWDGQVRKVVVFRLDALMFGVSLALLERHRPALFRRLQSAKVLVAGCLLGLAGYGWLAYEFAAGGGEFPATPGNLQIFPVFDLAAALMLPRLAVMRRPASPLAAAVERISLWSYSLYLSHELILLLLTRYALKSARLGHPCPEGLRIALMVLLPFAVSAALYRWFETPFLKLRDKIRLGPARPAAQSA